MDYEQIEKKALEGEAEAQYYLGSMYLESKNIEKAIIFLEKAVSNGYDIASNDLAVAYLQTKNDTLQKQGIRILFEKADHDDINAISHIGYAYRFGYGVEKNPQKSYEYFLRSACMGMSEAMNVVADYLEQGYGVDQNLQEAREWRTASIKQKKYDENFLKIQHLSDLGNKLIDEGDYKQSRKCFLEALSLVIEPKDEQMAATWLYAGIGDTYFFENEYINAKKYFKKAYESVSGSDNPYVCMMLGVCIYEIGDIESAKEFLKSAYLNGGNDVFEGMDSKYICALQENG